MSSKVDFLLAGEFTRIECYEDCPCDTPLVVWTGDDWDIEHVSFCSDKGIHYPANGVEFTHYAVLPCGEDLGEA